MIDNEKERRYFYENEKFLAVCLSALTVTGMLAGCGGAKGGDTSSAGAEKEGSSAEGSVYYLNFKPEIADQWEEIAAKYTEETGVPVKVKTAASNQYEQTLKSEMAKSDAPTYSRSTDRLDISPGKSIVQI